MNLAYVKIRKKINFIQRHQSRRSFCSFFAWLAENPSKCDKSHAFKSTDNDYCTALWGSRLLRMLPVSDSPTSSSYSNFLIIIDLFKVHKLSCERILCVFFTLSHQRTCTYIYRNSLSVTFLSSVCSWMQFFASKIITSLTHEIQRWAAQRLRKRDCPSNSTVFFWLSHTNNIPPGDGDST